MLSNSRKRACSGSSVGGVGSGESLANFGIQLGNVRRGSHDVIELVRLTVVCVPPNGLHPRPEGGGALPSKHFPTSTQEPRMRA